MKIKFLGAAGTVTGSGYLVTSNSGQQLLVDLGMFQGPPQVEDLNYQPLELDARMLSGVILTHAHLDHCGRLPILERLGFSSDIFMTAPTSELTHLTLLDSAKIAAEDHPQDVLYDQNNVRSLFNRFKTVSYDHPFILGDFQVIFRDAGHILGSASIELAVDGQTLVFSGDLGNTPEDLTKPTQFIRSADVVVMESTYGGRTHPEGEASDLIRAEINAVEKTGGVLLIPAFSLERTQELLHIISHLKSKNLVRPQLMVYMDSPMAQKATSIYKRYQSFMNNEIKKDFQASDPFNFPGLVVVESRQESMSLDHSGGPKVIIAGGGMMTGGRIVGHAKTFLSRDSTRLTIVGYQGEGTLGRELAFGAKEVVIDGDKVPVKATITDIQVMSSHADENQLVNWLRQISGVRKLILTHGEDVPRRDLAEKITKTLNLSDISLPDLNQELEIG
ncbi:hypothetical protein A2397_01135 [Candidatus Amesbacteria bacterium RIFOXYB1_FULL_44_23]|uniref:MBL fold metallo-hydrolase n=1 Tax=Candidatus Amesbacteria bacterium RIFOXYB1_FULL_44_23 TaxID=1797263 RepID=A0A1F4ZTN2_9BACT|nr:MAG: hypothetical protein A2397_01135 [Candidatus Amesbacteria bacterium RIFOXYB1_FULL_44_23]